jgi:hypothetical protein
MRHGIIINKFNHHRTKRIYNKGFLLGSYLKLPKNNTFIHRMNNDINQHFCGGWFLPPYYGNKQLFMRVVHFLKPFGVLHSLNKSELNEYIKYSKYYNLTYKTIRSQLQGTDLMFCFDNTLNKIYDLDALVLEYANNNINIIPDRKKLLSDYFYAWDIEQGVAPWETGLILGYPIENTISLYKEDRV